jgi:hypothetical protein
MDDSTEPPRVVRPSTPSAAPSSKGARYAEELGLWIGEVLVGLAPLFFDQLHHIFTEAPGVLARCLRVVDGQPVECKSIPDGPDAEICILAVVLSGLALLQLFRRPPASPIGWLSISRPIAVFGLAAIMVLAGMLYGWISAGINHGTGAIVWWVLGGALAGSLLLAFDRAARP